MRKGPTISEVMDYVNRRSAPRWKKFISARKGNSLNLVGQSKYESLSAPELEILDAVVTQHFHRSTDDLVHWCHKNCPEYEEVPPRSRKVIAVEGILTAAGKSAPQIQKISKRAKELAEMQEILC